MEWDGRVAIARFDEVEGSAGANASRLSQAQAHLSNAAANLAASPPRLPDAPLQYQKAWEVVKNDSPQFPGGGGGAV